MALWAKAVPANRRLSAFDQAGSIPDGRWDSVRGPRHRQAFRSRVPPAAAAGPDRLPGPVRVAQPAFNCRSRQTLGEVLTAHGITRSASARARRRACWSAVGSGARPAAAVRMIWRGASASAWHRAGAVVGPRLLIADEAVSALDVSIQAQILQLLDHIQRETGVSMIFITDDLRVASQIRDEIAVMQKGRIVESVSLANLPRPGSATRASWWRRFRRAAGYLPVRSSKRGSPTAVSRQTRGIPMTEPTRNQRTRGAMHCD